VQLSTGSSRRAGNRTSAARVRNWPTIRSVQLEDKLEYEMQQGHLNARQRC
jgi:hypothetical protein